VVACGLARATGKSKLILITSARRWDAILDIYLGLEVTNKLRDDWETKSNGELLGTDNKDITFMLCAASKKRDFQEIACGGTSARVGEDGNVC
jgi:hypothetical protein